ncbi:Cathepsin F [Clonorchis sinensis]|uniref:Cathepsin F n=1 Tax=Clonorchis sinensis TaxID=79923 RepID=A0A8T1MP79_CLOSI|nr:Cathepsin F [Clonorchis sinensis]
MNWTDELPPFFDWREKGAQLVDCDHVDRGCEGGFPLDAFMAVQRLGGLQLSIDYPYIASRQACQFNPKQAVAFVTGFAALPRNELLIAEYLHRNGPLSVGLNSRTLKFYNSGILNLAAEQCDPEALNHAALAVGFGTDESTPFWIIKNTFGKDWGEQGYFRIFRGGDTCGISRVVTSSKVV